MIRLLKFRAWNGKAMEYGGFCIHATGALIKDSALGDVFSESPVMQFTGLQDKNGVDVYEGDIVKAVSEIIRPCGPKHLEKTGRMSTKYHAIEYRDNCASFCIVGSALSSIRQNVASKYYEVVGDIYSTPELLEQSK